MDTRLPAAVRAAAPILLLSVLTGTSAFAKSALNPLQEMLAASMSLTDNQVSIVQGPALAIPMVLASIPLGYLADHGRRTLLLVAFCSVMVLASAISAMAEGFITLLIARAAAGLAALAITPIAFSLMADLCQPSHRGRATTVLVIGQAFGMSLAFAAGGYLADATQSWRIALLALTLLAAPSVLAALLLKEPARKEVSLDAKAPVLRSLGRVRGRAGPVAFGLVMIEITMGAYYVWAAPALIRKFDVSASEVASLIAGGLLFSGIAGPIIGGFAADFAHRKGGAKAVMLTLTLLTALALGPCLFALANNFPMALGLFYCCMTLFTSLVIMATAQLTIVVPNELRGLCISATAGLCTLFGVGAAPLLVSGLSSISEGALDLAQALATVCFAATLLGVIIFAIGVSGAQRTQNFADDVGA